MVTSFKRRAYLYRPAKTAMQSGRNGGKRWVLEFVPEAASSLDPVMAWPTMRDTQPQVRLFFPTEQAAKEYALQHGILYTVFEPPSSPVSDQRYSDNFTIKRGNSFWRPS